jgi:hypothetical protein
MLHEQENQNATSHTDGKAEDIDKGIRFVFENVPEGDFEVAFEHGLVPCCWLLVAGYRLLVFTSCEQQATSNC